MEKTIMARYLYRPPHQMGEQHLGVFHNTKEGHHRVIDRFNLRDAGKMVWRWEECYKTDIDYPGNKTAERLNKRLARSGK